MKNYTAKDYNLTEPMYPISYLINSKITGGRTKTYQEINNGRLKTVKRGKNVFVLLPDLVSYLNELTDSEQD